MRTVTAHLFDSVGGVVKLANLWQFDQFDADLGQAMAASIATVQTVLLGRVIYEEWASSGDPLTRLTLFESSATSSRNTMAIYGLRR